MKSHLKRPAVPKSWPIKRRNITFVIRPHPGPHKRNLSMPLKVVLTDILKLAQNSREALRLLHINEVLVDGVRRKELKFPVGVMDVVEIKGKDLAYRVVLEKEKLNLIPIDKKERATKLCRIANKSTVKGKIQLNLHDGKNILVDKDTYKTVDSINITIPKGEIKDHLKCEKGATIFLIGGKHSGDQGKIEDIIGNRVIYKNADGSTIETLKKYIFVVGKDKAIITLPKK